MVVDDRRPEKLPAGGGGSKMEEHHLPPYSPEYCVRFSAPAREIRA